MEYNSFKYHKRLHFFLNKKLLLNIKHVLQKSGFPIPKRFEETLKERLSTISREYAKVSRGDNLKVTTELLTLRTTDLSGIIGLDRSLQLVKESIEACYKIICDKEPKEIISAGLESPERFAFLILGCYDDYIERVSRRQFGGFLLKLSLERQEMVLSLVKEYLCEKLPSFQQYDSQKAEFKTYLYRAITFALSEVLKQNVGSDCFYKLDKENYNAFLESEGLNKIGDDPFGNEQERFFKGRKELYSFINNSILEELSNDQKSVLLEYAQLKTRYNGNESFGFNEGNLLHSRSENELTPNLERKIKIPELIEQLAKRPENRMMIKIKWGLHINYLNPDLNNLISKDKIDLALIDALKDLRQVAELDSSTTFYSEFASFLAKLKPDLQEVRPDTLRRREDRFRIEIRKLFKSDEKTLVKSIIPFTESFFADSIRSIDDYSFMSQNDFDMSFPEELLKNIVAVDLSDRLWDSLPEWFLHLSKVRELNLAGNVFTKDTILEAITTLDHLRKVILDSTTISVIEKQVFKEALPQCDFIFRD
ncbi:MAG: hypothetical protein ACRBF0_13940 [Calditrichia bacterium]